MIKIMIMMMILILIIIHVTNEMEKNKDWRYLPSNEDKKNSITK